MSSEQQAPLDAQSKERLRQAVRAPSWFRRALMPMLARAIASKLREKYPDATATELADRVREQLGPDADEQTLRMGAEIERLLAESRVEVVRPGAGAWVSGIVLVLANLFAVYGVLMLDWPVFPLVMLFWAENVIVGLFNIARMLCADPGNPALWLGKLGLIPFFCFHYGMFTAIHGVFVFALFAEGGMQTGDSLFPAALWMEQISAAGVWPAIAVLAISHAFSFVWNYLVGGEFRTVSLGDLMAQPYKRVVVLHVAIIFGGMAIGAFGSPVWALILLVVLKIAIDLFAHLAEHRRVRLGS